VAWDSSKLRDDVVDDLDRLRLNMAFDVYIDVDCHALVSGGLTKRRADAPGTAQSRDLPGSGM
jgi:hypothetical protein